MLSLIHRNLYRGLMYAILAEVLSWFMNGKLVELVHEWKAHCHRWAPQWGLCTNPRQRQIRRRRSGRTRTKTPYIESADQAIFVAFRNFATVPSHQIVEFWIPADHTDAGLWGSRDATFVVDLHSCWRPDIRKLSN